MSNTVYCMSHVSSSPKGNHYAKSVTYSFFEVSSCTYTLHIKAVMGPEYMVIRIGLLTLRKLIYKDCGVTNNLMLVYILIW